MKISELLDTLQSEHTFTYPTKELLEENKK